MCQFEIMILKKGYPTDIRIVESTDTETTKSVLLDNLVSLYCELFKEHVTTLNLVKDCIKCFDTFFNDDPDNRIIMAYDEHRDICFYICKVKY